MRTPVVLAGLAIGTILGASLWAATGPRDGGPAPTTVRPAQGGFPVVVHDDDAATDLVTAWRRWRTETFVAEGTWSRTLDSGGAPLTGPALIVQDPPRRLAIRLGTLIESIDGETVICDADTDDFRAPACTSGTGSGFDEHVERELREITSYVAGPDRPYDVARGADEECFLVRTRTGNPAAAWGLAAEFCFDTDTGAMRLARVKRSTAIDLEVMARVRAEVTDADFEVP